MNWTLVTEGLPIARGRYWACVDAINGPKTVVCTWEGEGWRGTQNSYVVAWMPLPQSPEKPWPTRQEREACYKERYG